MHLIVDWDWLLHADELLFFVWLVVWFVRFILGLIGRAPAQNNNP